MILHTCYFVRFHKILSRNCTLPLSDKGGVMALCVGLSDDGEDGDDKQLDTAIKENKHCVMMISLL